MSLFSCFEKYITVQYVIITCVFINYQGCWFLAELEQNIVQTNKKQEEGVGLKLMFFSFYRFWRRQSSTPILMILWWYWHWLTWCWYAWHISSEWLTYVPWNNFGTSGSREIGIHWGISRSRSSRKHCCCFDSLSLVLKQPTLRMNK